MPRVRASVKQRVSKLRKGWPSKTRSYSWRKGSARPAETLTGMKAGVSKASTVHRFTRWGPKLAVTNYDYGGGVTEFQVLSDDGGTSIPLSVGNTTVDTTAPGTGQYKFGGAMEFKLTDVPSTSDFTNLFDRYEIEQVDIEINNVHNSSTGTNGNTAMPVITYVPDFDDSAIPANASVISQYQRAKTWTFRGDGKPLKISLKPRVQVPVYQSGMTSAYSAGAAGTKVDLAYSAVPHYGLKLWLENCYSGTTPVVGQTNLTFKVKYHLKFLDPR